MKRNLNRSDNNSHQPLKRESVGGATSVPGVWLLIAKNAYFAYVANVWPIPPTRDTNSSRKRKSAGAFIDAV